MEREFDAAPQAGAVDRGHRGKLERGEAGEQLVPCAAALARQLRRHVRELVDVGAGAEDERLARQDEGYPFAGIDVVERAGGSSA